jgi:hypothetical protein
LRDLGLVGRIGGVELAAVDHLVDDGRDIVVIRARAEEAREVPGVGVGLRNRRELGHGLHFGERLRQVELREARVLGHVDEHVFDRLDADRLEHVRAIRRRVRCIAHADGLLEQC